MTYDLDQLKADREAGTDGPWVAIPTDPSQGWNGWTIAAQKPPTMGLYYDFADVQGPQDDPERRANARRMGHVPDMEDMILDMADETEKLRAVCLALDTFFTATEEADDLADGEFSYREDELRALANAKWRCLPDLLKAALAKETKL